MNDSSNPDDAPLPEAVNEAPREETSPVDADAPSPAPIEAHVPHAMASAPAAEAAEHAERHPSPTAEKAGQIAAHAVETAVDVAGSALGAASSAMGVAGTAIGSAATVVGAAAGAVGSIAASAKEALLSRARPAEKSAAGEGSDKPAEPAPKKPPVIAPEKPKKVEPVAVPSLRRKDDELEAELEAAMSGSEVETMLMGSGVEETKKRRPLEVDERVRAIVHRVQEENVFFNLGMYEGIAPTRQFKKPPEPGDMLDVVIAGYLEEDGLYEVVIPGGAVSVEDWSELQKGQIIEAKVVGTNTGGLDVSVNNIRGFVPASQISVGRTENFNEYLGKKLLCEVTEVNPARKRLVLSHRRIVEKELEALKEENFKTLQEGQVLEGKVTRIQDFGAFVDIGGGVEGLIHVSKISWDNVRHPSDVLSEGQQVRVKIDRIQADKGRIGLSLRDLQENPWDRIVEKYPVGQIVDGEVTRIMEFGVFVKLEPGIEGLIHVSELAHHRVLQPRGHAKVGEAVQVKVLGVEPDTRRISLSKKAVTPGPAPKGGEKKKDEVEGPAERTVKPIAGSLKGGRDKPSGGEKVGLNW